MPHVGSSSAEDLASSDEIKVFEDEGEDEKRASADLTDLKSSLITEGDQEKSSSQAFSSKSSSQQSSSHHQNGQRAESTSNFGKAFELGYPAFGYPLPHSPYHPNGTLGQMANKMAAAAAGVVGSPHSASPLPFMMPNMEGFPQPPPAHMGISPVMRCETKANISMWMDIDLSGMRNPLYNLPGPQYPHSVLSDLTHQLQWHNPAMYQLQQAAFRGPYPLPPVSSPAFPSFGRTPLMPHPSLSGHTFHPSFLSGATSSNASANSSLSNGLSNGSKLGGLNGIANGSSGNLLSNGECRIKQEHSPQPASHRQLSANSPSANSHDSSNNNNPGVSNKNRSNSDFSDSNCSSKLPKNSPNSRSQSSNGSDNSKSTHIKKPLNAFMIYMKEMRAKVIAESTLKESAAINQILGKRWHSLSRAEQEKYYDKARKERELHMEMHPGWTAKDNYAINAKRKKKKRERNADGERGALKKCRARYGLDQQNNWCKPCRRKKKCIRYMEAARALAQAGGDSRHDDDNLGSVGSVDAPTPDSKSTSDSDHDNLNSTDLSLSSPPTSEYHNFMSAFSPFSSAPSLNSSPNLHLNGHSNGHLSSPSLFYPHHSSSSLNSIGSRMSSLLTPNSPLASFGNFSSSSPLAPPIQAPATPSQMPPRNSPFSIEQLARPHCPNRSSPSKLSGANHHSKSNGSVTVSVITQLPTPPSSTDSTSATPTMLSVA